MTKYLLHQIINDIESIGCKVLACTMDQAGGNEGLQSSLSVTVTKPWFANPFDPSRKIFFLFDYVHVFKNTRNHTLDKTITLEDGTVLAPKKHFKQLQQFCRSNEISAGSYLKDILLDCQSSDRQTTSYAVKLLSTVTADLLRKYFPNDSKKMKLALICDILAKGFKVLTSCHEHDTDPYKCPLGVHYDLQIEALNDLMNFYEAVQFTGGRIKFQRGGLITTRATIWLHKCLRDSYHVMHLLVERVNQDYVESFFSIMREMGGHNPNPTALELIFKLQRHITSTILDVKSYLDSQDNNYF